MSSSKVDYSVVVPVFKGSSTIKDLTIRVDKVFTDINKTYQLIFIDDASPDNSWEVLKEIKSSNKHVSAIRLKKNVGQHKVLQCGFRYAKGKGVITLDDDLQNPPEEIPKLIEEFEKGNADVVYSVPESKEQSWARNFGSKMIEKLFKRFASTPGRGSSFKLIDRSIVDEIKYLNYQYAYVDEWISWFTTQYAFVTTDHLAGEESRYSFGKLLRMTYRITFLYTTLPLKIITWTGALTAIVSILLAAFFLYRKYMYGSALGFTSLIISISLSTGLIMASLGVIGEYIARIFSTQNKRGYFDIEEVLE